jgi:purine nucleosidase
MRYFKLVICFVLLFSVFGVAQDYPNIPAAERIKKLEHPDWRVKLVLDTDTYNEIDDQFALTYALLSHENFDLEAVYAAPFLNSRSTSPKNGMEKSYEEIKRILKIIGKDADGFAFEGSTHYLTDLKNPEKSPATFDLIERAMNTPEDKPLYVCPVGAITNIANAILIEPEIIKHIVVVWLGGHAHNWPNTAEFNLRQDKNAANVIFDSGVPFVQLPCGGVVDHLLTTPSEMEQYVKEQGDLGKYLDGIFDEFVKGRARSKVLWDMSAIAYVVDPKMTSSYLVPSPRVSNFDTYSFNKTRHQIRYVYQLSRDRIFADFFTKLEKHAVKK